MHTLTCVSMYHIGGRDKRGGPVLLLTQPIHLELDTLIEITDQDFFDMLAYFTSVPRSARWLVVRLLAIYIVGSGLGGDSEAVAI